ncbi:MAG: MetQ/NlpA family ABC transporter substrate-binding protein [Bacillota bacterium]|jgi:D-methionine transport system substrate-binding protein|nr:ABC transporter substrate-binding protein [Clostridia bacterium]
MKSKKILLLLVMVLSLSIFLFGCGKDSNVSEGNGDVAGDNETGTAEPMVLRVGATPVPHGEILEFISPLLQEKGVELEIREFTDYVLPNMALENKELDANFFQHLPYLEDFNEKNNTNLSSVVAVHFEPLGLYPGKTKTLEEIKKGDIIAVPNDTTNEARALLLLESVGIIKIKENAGLAATAQDIIENPYEVQIKELDAAQLTRSLPDVNFAVINGNFAVQAGLDVSKDALKAEDKDSLAAQTFANIVVVRTGDEEREEIKILTEVITSPEVREFINEKYKGTVIPVF